MLKKGIIPKTPVRTEYLMGVGINPHNGEKSPFNKEKWAFLIDSPYRISNKCCSVMKKEPMKRYAKETGRKPMTAQTAAESRLRTFQWLKNGCNGFEMKSPISNPMSFWTEQDVLAYIYTNGLQLASVYGEVVIDEKDQLDGQMNIGDFLGYELFDKRPLLKTTGCDRTGCIFCGYGCHLEKMSKGRFERLKITHPKIYDYIMRPDDQGGLNYKAVIDWLNENGNLKIRY